MDTIADGYKPLGSDLAELVGFTVDQFSGYLWKDGDRVLISLITSKQPGQGHFSALVQRILAQGYDVAVPGPFPRMEAILAHLGFVETEEWSEDFEEVIPVWIKQSEVVLEPVN